MKELPPLDDDISALLKTAEAGAPPPPPGLEAAVLAKVTATTAAAAGVTAAATTATTSATSGAAGVASGAAGVASGAAGAASGASTTIMGVLIGKPLAAIALAVGVAAGGSGIAYVATKDDGTTQLATTVNAATTAAPPAAPVTTATTSAQIAQQMEPADAVAEAVGAGPAERPTPVGAGPAPPERTEVESRAPQSKRSESALLEDARGKLSLGDGVGALEALREHARVYPRGKLHEERRALTVVAFAQQGDKARAKSAARAFEREYPSSLFLEMVRAAIDEEGGTQ